MLTSTATAEAIDLSDGFPQPDLRAAEAASRAGLATEQIERLPFDLSALENEGLFVNVDASGFTMLDRRLSWQALGITLPAGSPVAFRPPHCGLLPDRHRLALLRPAGRAHAALHRYSFRFTLTETLFETPAYRWIPWSAFEAFEQEFKAAQAALDLARQEVIDNHAAVRQEVIDTFVALAEDSAKRLAATGQDIPEGFREALVHGVSGLIPSPDALRERMVLRYRVGVILLGSEMLAEQRRAAEERLKLEAAEGGLRLQRQEQQVHERMLQEGLWAEQQRQRQQLEAEAEERRREAAIKERLRNLKIEAAKERLQEALSPIEEGAKQLHTAVFESATAIRTSLEKHGSLRGPAIGHVRKMARWFRLMNWNSDAQLEVLISDLEKLAKRPHAQRGAFRRPTKQVLDDIIQLCYADARALSEPRRLSALEV